MLLLELDFDIVNFLLVNVNKLRVFFSIFEIQSIRLLLYIFFCCKLNLTYATVYADRRGKIYFSFSGLLFPNEFRRSQ